MARNIWNEVQRKCIGCGVLFLIRQGSNNQMACHLKCRRRARNRQSVKFMPNPLRAVALTVNAVLMREEIYSAKPMDAIGYKLWSDALECWFPAPGKRQTYDGGYSEAPFFAMGGIVQKGLFIPWEAPRVPINGRYRLRWILIGNREMDPSSDIWFEIDFAQDMSKTDFVKEQKREYTRRIRLEPAPTRAALPENLGADDSEEQ